MGKVVIAVIGLIIGIGIGASGAMIFGGGTMAGIGVASGLSAGICTTVKAAQEEGIMTAQQVDQVMNRAVRDLAALRGLQPSEEIVGSAAACERVIARLQATQ
jgi:hypothetical protein